MYWPSAVTCMSVEAMGIEKSWISSIRLRRSGNHQYYSLIHPYTHTLIHPYTLEHNNEHSL